MRKLGTMDDFLTRLEWYADKHDVLDGYMQANIKYGRFNQPNPKDNGTPEDVARVSAFRYVFEEEVADPKWRELKEKDYRAYLAEKERAILRGELRNPAI